MPVDYDDINHREFADSIAGSMVDVSPESVGSSSSSNHDGVHADAYTSSEDSAGNPFNDFMSSLEESVLNLVKESSNAPQTAWDHWSAFSSAVDWQENWIRALLAFHVVLLSLVLLTRRELTLQTIIFFMISIMVMLSERLNTYCSVNWRTFSTQNYFDEHGVFTGLLFSAPLLFICFLQLLNFLGQASSALITAKRLELKSQGAMKKRAAAKENSDIASSAETKKKEEAE